MRRISTRRIMPCRFSFGLRPSPACGRSPAAAFICVPRHEPRGVGEPSRGSRSPARRPPARFPDTNRSWRRRSMSPSRALRSARSPRFAMPRPPAGAVRSTNSPPRRSPARAPARAPMMLVGEQPGDQEDLAGRPFVGPAGRILDRALEEAGISRREVFVTNAVKHFKHEMRGKRRLHKRPNATRSSAAAGGSSASARSCSRPRSSRWEPPRPAACWAARSASSRLRGRAQPLPDGAVAFVTIHPSFLLRIRDAADKEREYRNFVRDLQGARKLACAGRSA